jgi:hypothetical protein
MVHLIPAEPPISSGGLGVTVRMNMTVAILVMVVAAMLPQAVLRRTIRGNENTKCKVAPYAILRVLPVATH